jgi:ABC-type antimicrobial peptide transport system permease subunit
MSSGPRARAVLAGVVSPRAFAVAVAASIGVGIRASSIRRAARLDPIEALRHE